MYVGSTFAAGAALLLYELVNNALDRFLVGEVTTISVTIDGDTAVVTDDGPGLPFDVTTPDGWSLAEDHCMRYHRSRSVDDHAPHVHLRSGGCGLATVNAFSTEMDVVSVRGGVCWQQRFGRGAALTAPVAIEAPFARGTRVRFTLDREVIFDKGEGFPLDSIRSVLSAAAHLFPGVVIDFAGERSGPVGIEGLVPRAKGGMVVDSTVDDVRVLFAATIDRSRTSQSVAVRSWVNGAPMTEQGDHVEGFIDACAERSVWPTAAVLHVIMLSPEFVGPTRCRLQVPHVRGLVAEVLRRELARLGY
jgi:DNA gyrase subunit B